MSWMLANYGVDFEIDTTPYGLSRTWAPVCDGFDNPSETLNEQVQEYYSLCAKGYGSGDVIAIRPSYTLTGIRKVGDAAQDFIFGNRLNLMQGRRTNLRLSLPNADGSVTRYTNNVTMQEISSFGGASTSGAAVSVTFAFNGRPIVETVAGSAALTVTSAAGAASGTTVLTVVPTFPDAGCKFVYAYGDTAPTATAGSIITNWNDFSNGGTFAIANGKKVTVAMINVSTFAVVGSGNATVVSAT